MLFPQSVLDVAASFCGGPPCSSDELGTSLLPGLLCWGCSLAPQHQGRTLMYEASCQINVVSKATQLAYVLCPYGGRSVRGERLKKRLLECGLYHCCSGARLSKKHGRFLKPLLREDSQPVRRRQLSEVTRMVRLASTFVLALFSLGISRFLKRQWRRPKLTSKFLKREALGSGFMNLAVGIELRISYLNLLHSVHCI
jgi:hypothetical protein